VNLRANDVCEDEHEILTRKRLNSDCLMEDVTFTVHPGTLRATFPRSDEYCNRPSIDMPNGYPHRWIMQWMEVHVRSEHMLDGRRYDAELQMMHLGLNSHNDKIAMITMLIDASALEDDEMFQELLDKWQMAADEMRATCLRRGYVRNDGFGGAVAHVGGGAYRRNATNSSLPVSDGHERQLKHGKRKKNTHQDDIDNDELYWGKLYHPKYGDDGPPVLSKDYENATASAAEATTTGTNNGTRARRRRLAFPAEHNDPNRAPRHKPWPYIMWPTIHYYRYKGSLTQPPCSEIVHWRVFDEPSRISRRQYRQLTALVNSYVDPDTCASATITSPTGENYRPLQELNDDNDVTHCTDRDFTFWKYLPEDQ